MKSIFVLVLTWTLGLSIAHAQLGPPAGAIYANDELFKTVGTPTELPDRGQFNTLYQLGGDLASVSSAAPGDADFRGGRWEVRTVTFVTVEPTQFTNEQQVLDAEAAGQIEISDVVQRFECPLIKAKD
ncbi:MAG TPA: hypothetical protein VFR10_05770 [bacterium]|nr:hypothetical protein [bacterium]